MKKIEVVIENQLDVPENDPQAVSSALDYEDSSSEVSFDDYFDSLQEFLVNIA